MNALLLTLVLAAAGSDGKQITNASSIVDRDWVATQTHSSAGYSRATQPRQSHMVMSLRSDDDIGKGKAWILHFPVTGAPTAWKGYYGLTYDGNDDDNLILSLRMTRKYVGSYGANSAIVWDLESDWEAVGVVADLPIADNTVPSKLTITARRAFFVDSKGNLTRRYDEPSGFLDRIRYGKEEELPYNIDFFPEGETYRFVDYSAPEILKKLTTEPPGFTFRDR